MQRNFPGSLIFCATAFFLLLNWSCTKIDTTQLGADLLPAVDNVTTFASELQVNGVQGNLVDTPKISRLDNHVLGSINNDPIFGKTAANIYFQLKPLFFPYYYGTSKDTITDLDSAVLCLSFKKFFGDSTIPQHFSVYALNSNTSFIDSVTYKIDFKPDQPLGTLLGETTVLPTDLKNYIFFNHGKDSIHNQIRIKLTPAFVTFLSGIDSSANGAYHSDSLYKIINKGFAVVADKSFGGNGLFYISLNDTATRLEIFHRTKNAVIDTSFSRFTISTGSSFSPSASANFVGRDFSGSELLTPDAHALYVLSAPGTSAELTIPGLDTFKNSIIHRAELILEQVPGDLQTDQYLTAPPYLYVDLIDTAAVRSYKPVFYDLSPTTFYDPNSTVSFFPTGGINFSYYGGFVNTKIDPFSGRQISYYTFNLTRYIQNMLTKHSTNYKLRLTAPYSLHYYGYNIAYSNPIAYGRIKIGNGDNAHYKLRMRIVYSKL